MKTFFPFLLVYIILLEVSTRSPEEWKARSLYQIVTDRFARTDNDDTPCLNLNDYCGGTFKGIQTNLDYIQGLGFDAIWISPVIGNTQHGYHGYWASNLYEINPHFGTSQDLIELIQACHERDIWVMVDVVANHMGYVDNFNYTSIVPFSEDDHYNTYVDCNSDSDQSFKESCWLFGLPDLNHSNPFVTKTLFTWISDFVKAYSFDGLRLDSVQHTPKEFWRDFREAAGAYTLGEILSFKLEYLAGYQGLIDSILNYGLYLTLREAFAVNGSMMNIQSYYLKAYEVWPDVSLVANFVNNHDNPRYLNLSTDIQSFKAMLAFTICSIGIPIVYYGDEQAFSGGIDPYNRETLWTNMSNDTEIYQLLNKLNKFRKDSQFYKYNQTERLADGKFYTFTRGEVLFAFTNDKDHQFKIITSHSYPEGLILCNLLVEDDCVTVIKEGIPITLLHGEIKILYPKLIQNKFFKSKSEFFLWEI